MEGESEVERRGSNVYGKESCTKSHAYSKAYWEQ